MGPACQNGSGRRSREHRSSRPSASASSIDDDTEVDGFDRDALKPLVERHAHQRGVSRTLAGDVVVPDLHSRDRALAPRRDADIDELEEPRVRPTDVIGDGEQPRLDPGDDDTGLPAALDDVADAPHHRTKRRNGFVIAEGDHFGEVDVYDTLSLLGFEAYADAAFTTPVDVEFPSDSGDTVSIIPEPGTALLVGLGLAAMATTPRRRGERGDRARSSARGL